MQPEAIKGTLTSVGIVATWSMLMPNAEKSFHADPDNADGAMVAQLRSGAVLLIGLAAIFGGLQSVASDSPAPFVGAVATAALVVGYHEWAFRGVKP